MLKRKRPVYELLPEGTRGSIEEILSRKDNLAELDELFIVIGDWCNTSEKPVILIIDEVDSATNNRVFLDFLAQLRDGYIARDTDGIAAFHSVILAGVTDVKHLKSRIRDDDEHKVNSPWNTRESNEQGECLHSSCDCPRDHMAKPYGIAADFDIDMSLSTEGITGMLDEYEADHNTGMDTASIAAYIHDYTDGYPFLVSRICQLADTVNTIVK